MKRGFQKIISIRQHFDSVNSFILFYKRDKLRILIIAISIIFFVYLSNLATIRALSYDEGRHVIRSIILYRYYQQLLKNPGLLSPEKARTFLYSYYGGVYHVPYYVLFYYPPLYSLLTFFISLFLGINEYSARFIAILSSAILPIVIYEIGKLMYNRRIGLMSTLLMISFYTLIVEGSQALLEGPLTFLSLCALYFFFGAIKYNKRSWLNYSGLFLGLSLLTKQTGILVLLIMALFSILELNKEFFSENSNFSMRKYLLNGFRLLRLTAIVAGPWYLFLAIRQPHFLFSMVTSESAQNIWQESWLRSIGWGSTLLLTTGILTGVLGMIGVVYCLWRRNRSDKFVLSWLIGFLAVFMYLVKPQINLRWILPCIPAFFLCTSIVIDSFFKFLEKMDLRKFGHRNHGQTILFSMCFCVIFLLQVNRTSGFLSHPAYFDRTYVPMDETAVYVIENTPQSELRYRVLQIGWSAHFSPYAFTWYLMKNDENYRVEYWLLHSWETTPSQVNDFVMRERINYVVIYVETGHWGDLEKPIDLDALSKKSVEYSIAAYILKNPKYIIEKIFEDESFFIFIIHPSMVL